MIYYLKIYSPAINIRVLQVTSFETTGSKYSYASGFVVSLKHRLVLTNRHVICGGAPTVVDGLLHNKEEVSLKVLYLDPVHDFAFLSFDASQIKYMKLKEIELDPDGARVGREIRIMGTLSNEKARPSSHACLRILRTGWRTGRGESGPLGRDMLSHKCFVSLWLE